jgi:hypothetical protein
VPSDGQLRIAIAWSYNFGSLSCDMQVPVDTNKARGAVEKWLLEVIKEHLMCGRLLISIEGGIVATHLPIPEFLFSYVSNQVFAAWNILP